MLITEAFAQAPGPAGDGSGMLMQFFPLILIFAIMYFLLIRPQNKRMKEHREMVAALRRGDTVVTSGGIIGKVSKIVDDNTVTLEIADGVRVQIVRSTISEVRSKGEPAAVPAKAEKADEEKPDKA